MTPILVAAERTHFVLVNYLLETLNLTREEMIEVEELLGASFLNDKDTYDCNLGFAILLHSMEMRLEILHFNNSLKNFSVFFNNVSTTKMKY